MHSFNFIARILALAVATILVCIVPAAAGAGEPLALSLQQAMQGVLISGAGVRQAAENVSLAESLSDSGRAALLPQLRAEAFESRQTRNLKAQGIEFPGAPTLVGPFNTFDARLQLSQTLFDVSRFLEARGAGLEPEIARAQQTVAREQSASRVTLAYIEVLRNQQAVTAAQSDQQIAQALLVLAQDRKRAGVASGVDVARAETTLSQNRFALAHAHAALTSARITLRRIAIVPQYTEIILSDGLDVHPRPLPAPEVALQIARERRQERAALQARIRQLELNSTSARAHRLPTLGLFADYGASANTPTQNEETTYTLGAKLSLPLLSGGAISAGIHSAEARLAQARIQMGELDAQIEEDVRISLAQADSAAEQVLAAAATRDLAERELALARDRFAQGVVSNVEVVAAQGSQARARAGWVDAQAAFHVTRASLAAAMGGAQEFRLPAVTAETLAPPISESQP